MNEENKEIIEVEKAENTQEVVSEEKVENTKNEEKEFKKVEEPKKDKKGFCITSLVLGIIALICFCIWYISIPCGILAIIFGVLGLKGTTRGMAIAGLVTGGIGLVISSLIIISLFAVGFVIGITDAIEELDLENIDSIYEDYNYELDEY